VINQPSSTSVYERVIGKARNPSLAEEE